MKHLRQAVEAFAYLRKHYPTDFNVLVGIVFLLLSLLLLYLFR